MGRSERRKGHDFERKVAKDMRTIFPEANRGFQTRGGGKEEPDIVNTPFHIECKTGKRPSLLGAIKQAVEDNGDKARAPVAICHFDRGPTYAVMEYDMWLRLVKGWAEW